MIKLIIETPIPSGNRRKVGYRNGKPFIYKEQIREYDMIVNEIVNKYKGNVIEGSVHIRYEFVFPDNKKRDIDNRLKIINDCLETAGVLKDDSQIVSGEFVKRVEKGKTLTAITIEVLQNGNSRRPGKHKRNH